MFRNHSANVFYPQNQNYGQGNFQESHWYNARPLYPNVPCPRAQMYIHNIPSHGQVEKVPPLIINSRKSDEEFLEHFVNEKEETLSQPHDSKVCKISETKTALLTVTSLNEKLINISEKLKNKDLPECEWQVEHKVCEETKEKIQIVMETLRNTNFINAVKKNLDKRRKKRLREKRKREEWKVKKVQLREKRVRLHNEADNWIKGRQDVIEKEKQEENLRKDADVVLFDVRGKRNDSKKFLTLLRELDNLRKVKVTIAKARGEHLSSVAEEAFNNIITKLMEQWMALDREYSLEEQGLKLIIKTDNELKIKKQKKTFCDDWEIVLFGKIIPTNYFLRSNLKTFITMRTAWDKFISNNDGSSIPIGWVVPNTPSSAAWQKCLKKK